MTTQVNQILSSSESLFKTLVIDPQIVAMKAANPWMNIWPFSALIDAVVNLMFGQVTKLIDVSAIKLLNNERNSAYQKASMQLFAVEASFGRNSKQYEEVHAQALKDLSRFVMYSR